MWTLHGEWQDGVSSQRRLLALQVDSSGRIASADQTVAGCHFRELRVSDRLGDTPRFLQFPDGARLICRDQDTVDALCRRFQRRGPGVAHRLEKRLSLALLALALVVGASFAGVRYGVPLLAKTAAFWLPDEAAAQLGAGTLAALDKVAFTPSQLSPGRQQELQQLLARLKPANEPGLLPLQLHLRHGGEIGANAFALPDGSIIVTDELVELAQTNAELAGVLAHEIGHVRERHAMRHTLQSSGTALVLLVLFGDASSVTSLAASVPTALLELHYSREFEWEADAYAAQLMQAKRLPLAAFSAMLARLEHSHSPHDEPAVVPAFLNTHPVTSERIRRFQQHRQGS